MSLYFSGIIEKNYVLSKLIKAKCLKRYAYTNNKKSFSHNISELKIEMIKKLEKTNKKFIKSSLTRNFYISKYKLEDRIHSDFKVVNLSKLFYTQKRKSFYNLISKNKINKKVNFLNTNKTNSKLPLLEDGSDKINEMFKILCENQRMLNYFKYIFLINYLIIILAICFIFALSGDSINLYIISKIEKILEEIKKSKEIENNMKEIVNSLLNKIIQEEKNKMMTSAFFIDVLRNSKKEIGNIFIEILEAEEVKNKLKSIFYDISVYLCNNKNIQKNCYHLLSEAIHLPESINSSERWLVNLFNSNNVKQNIRDIIYKDLFKNEEMINNSIFYLQKILYDTLQNKSTQEQTKLFFSSLLSNQEFQHQLSEHIWKVFKLALSPKWMNNEDFKMDIKETKKNEIKETQTKKNNIKDISTNNDKTCKNNIITTDNKTDKEKDRIYAENSEKKEQKKYDLTEKENKNDTADKSIKSNLNDTFSYLNDENHLKKEIKRVIEIYENEKDKIENNIIYNKTSLNHSKINEIKELKDQDAKEKKIELNELINDDILKESIKYMLEISVTLNNIKSLLFSSNMSKKKYLDIPICKIKNIKEINKIFTISYLNNILKQNNINEPNEYLEKENNELHEENKLYNYSLEEKIKLTLIDMLLFYSYKYYFYYYYIIKLKLIFQNLLNVKAF
ncbi:conserved Plasmodium protein, unknown function [Plasmodium relictum]|uniref:Uncharacterized protein n=1 Tax=Plasmodium relictum TaxID=85471 RepID=A0A1J1H2B8_PLARL|nr:conserved Plasmodium protein, unknown function [Plasmodium relictum]CRG98910.1 conserved Plasmodium protein, unknown function [Plasmodium relictum]